MSFFKTKSGCKFGAECSFPQWKVEEQTNKKPKKGGDKSAAGIVESVRQLVVCRRTSRRNLHRSYGRAQKSLDQFDEYDSQELRCVRQTSENAECTLKKTKLPHQRAIRPRRRVETCQEFLYVKKRKNYILFAYQ